VGGVCQVTRGKPEEGPTCVSVPACVTGVVVRERRRAGLQRVGVELFCEAQKGTRTWVGKGCQTLTTSVGSASAKRLELVPLQWRTCLQKREKIAGTANIAGSEKPGKVWRGPQHPRRTREGTGRVGGVRISTRQSKTC
jgi:hypothetical protein